MSVSSLLPFLAVYAAIFLLRRQIGAFFSILAVVVTVFVQLYIGIDPPLPSSVISLFAGFILVAAFLYVTASQEIARNFAAPVRKLVLAPGRTPIVLAFLVVLPVAVGWFAYKRSLPDTGAPASFRVVHPAPPDTVSSRGQSIDTKAGDNPFRALESDDPQAFEAAVSEGRRVYYENCYFCHGDRLAADGHLAEALLPRPISFRSSTTISLFTETFLFWRVAKGGPGLPAAATPWDSAMPAWDAFLTNDEMWKVILYLYDRTGQRPRVVSGGAH